MNAKELQGSAILIIMIVVLVPFCISDAYAASLNIQKISGADGADGFVRTTDILTIQVSASISETEEVTPEKLRVYRDDIGYLLFNNCTFSAGSLYICNFTRALFGYTGGHTYRVDLHTAATQYDDFAEPIASEDREVFADVVPASVSLIAAEPNRSTTGDVEVSYTAVDFGPNENDNENCSGVARIEFYRGDYAGELIRAETPSPECTVSGSFQYSAGTNESQTAVCARAYDKLNQSSFDVMCADIFVDFAGPEPDIASLEIADPETEAVITHVGTQPIPAQVSLVFDSPDIVVNSVRADFGSIAGGQLTNAPFSYHTVNGTMHRFIWANVPLRDITECSFDVTAEDYIGNEAETSVPCGIVSDLEGPNVTLVSTPAMKGEMYYFGKSTTMAAKVLEAGIGLGNRAIFADLTNINGQNRVRPDNCSFVSGSEWDCFWYDIVPSVPDGDEYPVSISAESRDDLGNIMGFKYTDVFGVDRTSPEINQDMELLVTPSGATAGLPYENLTIAGDTLEFVIEVSDAWLATANLSAFGGPEDALPADCWRENETTMCRWEVLVQASGPYDADVKFDFVDFAGNRNSITRSVFVSGTLNDTSPNYWQHTVTCTPEFLDREILSIVNHPYYCHIKLKPINNPLATIESFTMPEYPASCYSNVENTSMTDFVSDAILFNNYPGELDPYLSITMQIGDFLYDGLSMGCQFEIYTKIGDNYTLYPELENVTIPMQFYDLPSGTLADNYADDIAAVQDDIDWVGEWMNDLNELFDLFEGLCNLYATINTALAGLTAVGAFLGLTSAAAKGTPYGEALEATWLSFCKADDSAKKGTLQLKSETFDKFCSFVNCKWSESTMEETANELEPSFSSMAGQALQDGLDVKQSIVWSIGTLCVPGILYNINKWKEIQCQWLVCMMRDVPSGVPKYVCDDIKGLLECKFWWGQIFNLFPFAQAWSSCMENMMNNLADPLATIGWIVDKVSHCGQACKKNLQSTHWACTYTGLLSMIGDAISEVTQVAEQDDWGLGFGEDNSSFCYQYNQLINATDDGGFLGIGGD